MSRGRAVCWRKRGLAKHSKRGHPNVTGTQIKSISIAYVKAALCSQVWPVLPQPVVTHLVPAGMLVVVEARHTGDTRAFIWTGEDSFRRVMSLLKFWEL